jgi:hypothetical protein
MAQPVQTEVREGTEGRVEDQILAESAALMVGMVEPEEPVEMVA